MFARYKHRSFHLIQAGFRNVKGNPKLRVMSSSSPLTPEEAGRRARALALASSDNFPCSSMETQLAPAGVRSSDDNAAMAPPIHMATTYTRPADGMYLPGDSIYGREDNPTRLLLEEQVGLLECHKKDGDSSLESSIVSCAFASGMMTVSSIVLAHAAPLRVILHKDLYMGVTTVLADVFARFGV